ncbi:MAG: hypothetical protein LKM38_09345 [Pseudomonas veronii]|nr:hypothetical protein [Pseudomonas veronii]
MVLVVLVMFLFLQNCAPR